MAAAISLEQNQLSASAFRYSPSEMSLCCEKNSEKHHSLHRYTSPRLLHLSPCHGNVRPSSRGSLQTSRKSSSHNSLTTQTEADDSSFITQAISHDTLSTGASDIADMYNVPFDSDIYSIPIDSVTPSQRMRLQRNGHATLSKNISLNKMPFMKNNSKTLKSGDTKRHSVPSTSWNNQPKVSKMTLTEIKSYVQSLGETSEKPKTFRSAKTIASPKDSHNVNNNSVSFNSLEENLDIMFCNDNIESNNNVRKVKKHIFAIKHKKKECTDDKSDDKQIKKSPVKSLSLNLKQTLCKLFRFKKISSVEGSDDENAGCSQEHANSTNLVHNSVTQRALPSVPPTPNSNLNQQCGDDDSTLLDFPTSIQIVKDVSLQIVFFNFECLKSFNFVRFFSMGGIGARFRWKLLKNCCQWNLKGLSFCGTAVTTTIYSRCRSS